MNSRTKERLRSGEMTVSGDQWPIFIYQGYNYDSEDPWNGLFRSSLLVSVSQLTDCADNSSITDQDVRGTSIFSPRQAPSRKNLRPPVPETPVFTV
jgi:hypothetical protein